MTSGKTLVERFGFCYCLTPAGSFFGHPPK